MKEMLIDTNIYSHALRGDPETVSVLQRAHKIAICSISIGELLSGFKAGNRERENRERGKGLAGPFSRCPLESRDLRSRRRAGGHLIRGRGARAA